MNLHEKYKDWCQKTANAPEIRQQLLEWYQQHQEKKIRYLQQYLPQWEHFLDKHLLTSQEIQHFWTQTFSDSSLATISDIALKKTVPITPTESFLPKTVKIPSAQTKSIGPYDIVEKLGQGGMGIVYKVQHRLLNKIAVLKLILPSAQNTPELLKRFHRESQIMAKLKHPHIVQVYDSGEQEGQHYFAMEYVAGVSLQKKIQEKLPVRESLRLVLQVLDALAYAHSIGVIHRDLKPENIFVTPEGQTKLGDFGLAKKQDLHSKTKRLTKSGEIFGSPSYMAPEQAMGETSQMDHRVDIYAMGVCLYEMLTLQCPHEGRSLQDLLMKVATEKVKPPSEINPEIHPDLEGIVLKALEKDKKDRYSSAEAFSEDIKCFLEGYPVSAKPLDWKKKASRWFLRNRKIGLAFLSGILILLPLYGFQQWTKKKQFRAEIHKALRNLKDEPTPHDLLKVIEQLKQIHTESPSLLKELESKQWNFSKKLIESACSKGNYSFAELLNREISLFKTIPEALIEELSSSIQIKRDAKQIANLKRLDFWISEFEANRVTPKNAIEAVFEMSKMKEEVIFQKLVDHLKESHSYFLNLKEDQEKHSKKEFYIFVVRVLERLNNSKAIPSLLDIFQKIAKPYSILSEGKRSLHQTEYLVALVRALATLNTLKSASQFANIPIQEILMEYQQKFGFNTILEKRTASAYKKILASKDPNKMNKIETISDPSVFYLQEGDKKILINDIDGAIQNFSLAIQKKPRNLNAYTKRGFAWIKKKDFAKALKDFQEIIRLEPNRSEGYMNRGTAKFYLKDLDGAIADVNQAILLNPYSGTSFATRGFFKIEKKDLDGAIADLNEAIRLNPKDIESYHCRAKAKKLRGDIESALLDYNEAIRLNPDHIEFYLDRGNLKMGQRNFSGALLDLNEAIRLNPQRADSYCYRGFIKQELLDYNGAFLDYNESLRLDPKFHDTYYYRALLRLHLNDKVGSKADFQKVLELTRHLSSAQITQIYEEIFNYFPELRK